MQERLPPIHSRKLPMTPLKQLLNSRRIPNERRSLLHAHRRDVTDGGEDGVWDPFDEVLLVLLTDVVGGFFDVSHGDFGAAEDGGDC